MVCGTCTCVMEKRSTCYLCILELKTEFGTRIIIVDEVANILVQSQVILSH